MLIVRVNNNNQALYITSNRDSIRKNTCIIKISDNIDRKRGGNRNIDSTFNNNMQIKGRRKIDITITSRCKRNIQIMIIAMSHGHLKSNVKININRIRDMKRMV